MPIASGSSVLDGDGQKYLVGDQLGHGGFGTVFLINRESDSKPFALKTLINNLDNQSAIQSFINEARLAVSIKHANVINYLYFHDGSRFPELPPYIIMEYANNGNLKNYIDEAKSKKQAFDSVALVDLLLQLTNGMSAINAVLVHRDIKPENILVQDGVLKIADFGLAKIVDQNTRSKTFKGYGTFQYIAPEAWRGEKNTTQMDIYAMGIVFYELSTLNYPYVLPTGDDFKSWVDMHMYADAKDPLQFNPSLNPKIRQLIQKMIEKRISDRHKDWSEIKSILNTTDQPHENGNPHVLKLLNKRLEVDNSARQKKLEAEKLKDELEAVVKTAEYQFKKEIFDPLIGFIDAFNKSYANGKIEIQRGPSEMLYNIRLISGSVLKFNFQHLKDADFQRKRQIKDYGMTHEVTKLERPMVDNRKVICWGFLKEGTTKKGFNLLLLERPGEIYGDWFSLHNTISPIARMESRPEPFPFELNQLEEELKYLRAMHVYQSSLEKYVIDHSIQLFEEFNS